MTLANTRIGVSCGIVVSGLLAITPSPKSQAPSPETQAPSPETQAPSPAFWFKGNLHTHTLWSDGDDYPEMVADWYKQNGYHFLGLSDHNVLQQGQRWFEVTMVGQEAHAGPTPMKVRKDALVGAAHVVSAVNRIGHEAPCGGEGIEFWGQSFVADTSGQLLAKASVDKEEVMVVEVDLNKVDVTRTHWPFLRDRRIDAYGDITKRLLD